MADEENTSAPKEASDPEFFTRKVMIIGDLQTKRALWANQVSRLKGALMIGEEESPELNCDAIEELDRRVNEVSKKITGFAGQNSETLDAFCQEVEAAFAEMEKLLGRKVSADREEPR